MIKKPKLMKKITPGLALVLVFLIILISIQIVYFDRIPNNFRWYGFSENIPQTDHNYTDVSQLYDIFSEEDDWEVKNTSATSIRAVKTHFDGNYTEHSPLTHHDNGDYTEVFIELTSDEELKLSIERRFTFETRGPPIHPRAIAPPELGKQYVEQTRESISEVLTLMDIHIPEEEVNIRSMSFILHFEQQSSGLYLLSYILLYLIATSLSLISKNPLIPSVKGEDIGIFITGMWYFSLAIIFFFLSVIIIILYHGMPIRTIDMVLMTMGLGLSSTSFILNYLVHIKNNNVKGSVEKDPFKPR